MNDKKAISPKAFEKAVNKIGIGEWMEEYHGRFHHQGWAVLFKSVPDYGRFIAGLSKDPDLAALVAHDPHMDNLGNDLIASWDKSLFTE